MHQFPAIDELRDIIQLARREDLGGDDVTSRLLVPENAAGVGTLLQKEVGIVCGLPLVEMICRAYDERLRVEQIPGFHLEIIEGRFSDASRTPLLRIRGPLRSLLSAERVMLNFLQHLSGVATLTQRFVRRVEGTGAKIYDTRKTIPGLRALEKYAVRSGGGHNHRLGLHDGLLVKDNHLASVPLRDLSRLVAGIVARSRSEDSRRFIEIEVDSLEQLREVLKVDGVDVILLDNMDCPRMQDAVELRDKAGSRGRVLLEASGGVTLETVRTIAHTGVDRIAVGALTHSAPALDISLDIEILTLLSIARDARGYHSMMHAAIAAIGAISFALICGALAWAWENSPVPTLRLVTPLILGLAIGAGVGRLCCWTKLRSPMLGMLLAIISGMVAIIAVHAGNYARDVYDFQRQARQARMDITATFGPQAASAIVGEIADDPFSSMDERIIQPKTGQRGLIGHLILRSQAGERILGGEICGAALWVLWSAQALITTGFAAGIVRGVSSSTQGQSH